MIVASTMRSSLALGVGKGLVVEELQARARLVHIDFEEALVDALRRHFLAFRVGDRLDVLAELDLQVARQVEAVVGLQDIGDAALAGLRVDADDRLVAAADILRVDRQIGHFPDTACWPA